MGNLGTNFRTFVFCPFRPRMLFRCPGKLTRSFFPANRESCGKPYLLLMQSVDGMPKENVWHRGGQQEPTSPHPPQIPWSSSGVVQQRREAKLGGEALRKEVFHPHGVSGQVQENRTGNVLETSRTSHPKYLDRPHSPNPMRSPGENYVPRAAHPSKALQ